MDAGRRISIIAGLPCRAGPGRSDGPTSSVWSWQRRGDRSTPPINHATHERLQADTASLPSSVRPSVRCRRRRLDDSAVSVTQFQSDYFFALHRTRSSSRRVHAIAVAARSTVLRYDDFRPRLLFQIRVFLLLILTIYGWVFIKLHDSGPKKHPIWLTVNTSSVSTQTDLCYVNKCCKNKQVCCSDTAQSSCSLH